MKLNEKEVISHSFHEVNGEVTKAILFNLSDGTSTVIAEDMIEEKINRGELVDFLLPSESQEDEPVAVVETEKSEAVETDKKKRNKK